MNFTMKIESLTFDFHGKLSCESPKLRQIHWNTDSRRNKKPVNLQFKCNLQALEDTYGTTPKSCNA